MAMNETTSALKRRFLRSACAASLVLTAALLTACDASAEQVPEVAAKIGETPITKAEVMEKAAGQLAALEQQEYDILKGTVDAIVQERLVEAEAAKEGMEAEAWLEKRLGEIVTAPSDEEIEAFYNANRARLQGQSLDQAKPLIANYLRGQSQQTAYNDLIGKLKRDAGVVVLLDPPRLEVPVDDDPFLGAANAKVTIVGFSDYQCPYCSRAEATMKQILEEYGDRVKIVTRDFPLDFHAQAQKAHEAAGCALEQDKFWEMHNLLFTDTRALQPANLRTYAEQLNLDMGKFDSCLESGSRADEIANDMEQGRAIGVEGTPAFFVNGRSMRGAAPFEQFKEIIEDELRRANEG